jgi:spore maturation protein CgeB
VPDRYDLVVLGLSMTSSWGNGHATTYRSLIKGLAQRGRRVLFLEREQEWYAENRDLPTPSYCDLALYSSLPMLHSRYGEVIREARAVVVGSFVPEGIGVAEWVLDCARGTRAFYDIDTPLTLAMLAEQRCGYISRPLMSEFDIYLSFTGGPLLQRLEREFGVQRAQALYCSVDVDAHQPIAPAPAIDLGYLGTYSRDRQPKLNELLLEPARRQPRRRFAVVGAQYPEELEWPANVTRNAHLPPAQHAAFYGSQRFTLNVTRADMVSAGYSPSVRLFEAGACATPVISDKWPGIDQFFDPGSEILLADSSSDVESDLQMDDTRRQAIGTAARRRVLAQHAGPIRAAELENALGFTAREASVA